MSPQVSVVLPVFNGAPSVARAVSSILEQSFREIELIVVDDGSTDESAAILAKLRDTRLRIISTPHRGVAAAANAGAEVALAPFIARMDADDFAYPERLQKQLAFLRESRLDVVGCQVRIIDQTGESPPSMMRYQRWINDETISNEQILGLRFVEFPLVNPTLLARREYFEQEFVEGDYPEDYDLMLRAASKGMRFGKVAEVLLDWTDDQGRLTRTDPRYSGEAFDRCRRRHLLAGPLRNVQHVDLWGLGQTGKPWLRWLQSANRRVRRGYDIDSRKVGETIHGVQVTHADRLGAADGTPLIIAVGSEKARETITPTLLSRGYHVGVDAWFVA